MCKCKRPEYKDELIYTNDAYIKATGEMPGGHTPQYYDLRDELINDFMEGGYHYLVVSHEDERKILYDHIGVKTADEALCKRQYAIYFNNGFLRVED